MLVIVRLRVVGGRCGGFRSIVFVFRMFGVWVFCVVVG